MQTDENDTGTSTEALTVRVEQGTVRGYAAGSVFAWKGVPYASAGQARRFRSALPAPGWDGELDCREFGPIAPQAKAMQVPMDPRMVQDEDCLSLNVWAARPDGEPRPVMVWIHGGAYCVGASSQTVYDGRRLAEAGDLIVVTVNYRLGVFGFVDLSSFGEGFESNIGLRDQIAALEWVRDNIAAFGGDPGNVTVFGESSGAGSVTTLMTSPRAEGLFHRAIAQSAPATSVYGTERAAAVAARFLELAGVGPGGAAQLLDRPFEELTRIGDKLLDEVVTTVPGTLAMAPVVDRDLVPRYPVAAFQKGFAHRIPLIIGTNRDEASIFRLTRSPIMPVTADTVNQMFTAIASDHPDLPPTKIADIISAYPDFAKSTGAMAVSRDAAFRMPCLWIADAHSRHSPTWVYRFDHATPMLRAARVGAGHATELPYVFGNFGTLNVDPSFWLGGRKTALEVAGRVQRRWLAFARHGVPAALDASKHWARYTEETRSTLLIDKSDTLASDPDRGLRAAWGNEVMGFS
ncbi:carboxylesterase/lipase family protein [Rhodococcus sp. NPDC003318]|uniref:carboxylesterase/lipase family protein n=1 Tax=Rhodococcus sp. NPDC003318 TaxID=3364503 RepID=UPI003686EE64